METRRWLNQSQPQTLVYATMLLYIDAVFYVLRGAVFSPLGLVLTVASVAAGFGIANEQRWGYYLGVAAATLGLLPFVFALLGGYLFSNIGILINFGFALALFVLLIHPQSREYQKIWFEGGTPRRR